MSFLGKFRRDFRAGQRGVAILELALVLPVLLIIGLGVIEFGNYIYQLHLVGTGVRDAARYLSGITYNSTTRDAAKNLAVTGQTTSGGTPRVPGWTVSQVTVVEVSGSLPSVPNNDGSGNKLYRGGDNIYVVTVNASVPYTSLGFLGFLQLGSLNLNASHQERHFGIR